MFHATIDLADVQDFRGRLHGELICIVYLTVWLR